jgi:hypothetical protein
MALPDLGDVDWGSLPAWAGAVSLLLAFRIFWRDRTNAERVQVDLIGTWWTIEHYPRSPDEEAGVRLYIRNASQLPIEVVQLAYEVHGRWRVPSGSHSWRLVAGVNPRRNFLEVLRPVAPEETWNSSNPVNVADTIPEEGARLDPLESVRCVIVWLLLIDSAGRRWELQPGKGVGPNGSDGIAATGKTNHDGSGPARAVNSLATVQQIPEYR